MTDEENHEHDESCYVRFEWQTPDSAEDNRLHIVAYVGEARLHIDFEDDGAEGTEELGRILQSMPTILKYVRNERDIKREVAGVDQDLLDLLAEGDDK